MTTQPTTTNGLPRTEDRYGRIWESRLEELCPECGQPDNCGDCSHGPLSEEDARSLGVCNSIDDQFLRRVLRGARAAR